MANKDDYLTYYREFFENFAHTVNPNDQLPVKLASYKLINIEVVGGIIDWTTQYLTQKKCPPNLLAPLIKIVIEEIRKACKKQPVLCGFNPSDNAYEPLKLMQTVMAKTNEVCLRYLDNSMLCSLPSPANPYFVTSVCAVKNTRRRMEDRHVVIHDLNTMFNIQEASPSSYYAVFDGHAGHDAAAYSSAHLHQFLAENKYFISNPEQALLDAFCKTDALFIDKCRVENLSSGTTAVVALLRPKEKTLYIAWVGDSQALLVNQGRLLQVVNPHKPSRKDERERIEKQGGFVMLWGTWRVNGQLAVSRAIGDAEYKPHVIAVPDIREIPLDGGEDFLILACDGLWDFVSEDCAARSVYNLVTENPDDIDRISQHLVQLSRELGSADNISVIVVFLREPSKIAAEAHWANRNCTQTTMDASLDNANNPFTISNGATTDNIISQKSDGLLLNLTDNFKQNGADISPTADFYGKEKSNGKRSASEFDDDDFGPETDVDAVDNVLSPVEKAKGFGDVFSNNNPAEGVYNPYMEHQEKAALEIERELQKQQSSEFEEQRLAREETPTPPADTVHDVSGLVDNAAESESEDEWNYFKGDEANKENISPQPDKEVAEVPEEDDNMSQLNPNAAEFVPVSPTRSIPSPACRTLLNDRVISQSPSRPTPNDIDINVPTPVDFEKEVKSRPSDVDSYSNGHEDSDNRSPTDLIETLLNGKNIDEIPEFQPGSTPSKIVPSEEFHFGPNAAPFTPAKFLDQSEAALSTKAVYGDESTATLGTSFNESVASQDTAADLNLLNKESDPMSMSFYADKEDNNPFDLNQVHVLPDNIDEFLKKSDTSAVFNDTISDLPEHHPLGEPKDTTEDVTLNNDDALQITDLDKQAYYEEKELASPLEPEKELSEADRELLIEGEECDLPKTPEPTHENLLEREFCIIPAKMKTPEVDALPRDVELIPPELTDKRSTESTSPRPESPHEEVPDSKSPLHEATEVSDLLHSQPESLSRDVELISPEPVTSRPESTHEEFLRSPQPDVETSDLLHAELDSLHSKSPIPEATEIGDLLQESTSPLPEPTEVNDLLIESHIPESKSPLLDAKEDDFLKSDLDVSSKSPIPDVGESNLLETETEIVQSKSPLLEVTRDLQEPQTETLECNLPLSESPRDILEEKSPIDRRSDVESPVCELPTAKSPVCELAESRSPVTELLEARSPVCEFPESKSSVCELPESDSLTCEQPGSKSPVCELQLPESKSPLCELPESRSPVSELRVSESPVPELEVELPVSKSPIAELQSELPTSESPVCKFERVASPVCELRETKSPLHEFEASSPVCDRPLSKSPVYDLECAKSPIPDIDSKSPDLSEPKSLVPEPTTEVCSLPRDVTSPVSMDATSPIPPEVEVDFIKTEDVEKAEQHFEEICKSEENLSKLQDDYTSPEVIEQAQEHFEEVFQKKESVSALESPQEDVTSSLKDDVASPAKSPIPDEIIEDSFAADEPTPVVQDIAGAVQESVVEAASEILDSCPISAPKSITDTTSVTTTEINSFLECSIAPDVIKESLLTPLEQKIDTTKVIVDQENEHSTEQPIPATLDLSHPLSTCVYPLPTEVGEQIDIKTEKITPEFAEQAIVTPSEESKQEDVPTAPLIEEPLKEPVVEEKKIEEQSEGVPTAAVGVVTTAIVGAAAIAAVTATAESPKKAEKEEKKKPGASPMKKPTPARSTTAKTTSKTSTAAAPKAASRLSASPKSAPAKTSAAKPSTVPSAPKPATTKPSPKPRPTTAAPKSVEKKPLVNGDIKPSVRSTLTARKVVSETTTPTATTKSTTPRPATVGATKLSPTKSATSKPAASRPATAPTSKTTTTSRTGSSTTPSSVTSKPRPTSLGSKTTAPSSATKPATMNKPSPTKTSPKSVTAAAPKPRPPPTTTVIKQRVPLTKTVSKTTADAEKQIKESANKLTASRTVSSTTRTTATARSTTSTTVRKIESKTGPRTTKTTTTTTKSTTAKKPTELVRNATNKTKTTKIEKPKENGVTTVVTEEITVVNSTSAVIDSESQLIKDNSPVDNKLIIENTLIETNTAD